MLREALPEIVTGSVPGPKAAEILKRLFRHKMVLPAIQFPVPDRAGGVDHQPFQRKLRIS